MAASLWFAQEPWASEVVTCLITTATITRPPLRPRPALALTGSEVGFRRFSWFSLFSALLCDLKQIIDFSGLRFLYQKWADEPSESLKLLLVQCYLENPVLRFSVFTAVHMFLQLVIYLLHRYFSHTYSY